MKSSTTRRIITHLTAGAFIFYVFSGVSSVLNYAFYPVIARFVSVEEYGEIQFLVSMFAQLAVGFVVLNILAIIIGVELKKGDEQRKAIHSLNLVAGIITTAIVITGAILLIGQKDTLNLTSTSAIVALCLSLLINVPFTVAIGRLQGNDKFIASGVVSILGALFKLIFSLLFVILGYGVAGAIFGIFVGMATSLAVVEVLNMRVKNGKGLKKTIISRQHLARLTFIKDRAAVGLVAIIIITLLSAADSVTSRIALSNVEAGHYAAIATVAKMILAATSPLMWLALPSAIKHNNRLVLKYILITFAVGLTASLCFSVAPRFFTGTIIGVSAQDYIHLIPLAAVGMTLCAVAFVVLTSAICLGCLKSIIYTSAVVITAYIVTSVTLSPITDPLTAALYGQVAGSLCFIIGLSPKVIRRSRASIQYFN